MWAIIKEKWFCRGGMSPWLVVCTLCPFIAWLGVEIFIEKRMRGGTFAEAYYAWAMRWGTACPNYVEMVLIIIAQAALLWFTFMSKSKLVKDGDKCAVRWMMLGAGLGWLIIIPRHISKAL